MKVLITGGLGYIGSHTVYELLKANFEVVIVDNLSNSKIDVLYKLEELSQKKIKYYNIDASSYKECKNVFEKNNIDSVIHFAGFKAVGESVERPLIYYENNIHSTLNILRLMKEFCVDKLVFSSSATVYGVPKQMPIKESHETGATNPYGRTKLFLEEILKDFQFANNHFSISVLRYFNPIGAHKSGLLGEDPQGIPNNLVPYVSQVANEQLDCLSVFGNDYNTKDGTGVRDYIHVSDLSYGHVKALEYIYDKNGYFVHNLGTGIGYSVLEIIEMFETVSGRPVNFKFVPRRPGDIAVCYADPSKAYKELNWSAKKDLREMIEDTWRFEKNHRKSN